MSAPCETIENGEYLLPKAIPLRNRQSVALIRGRFRRVMVTQLGPRFAVVSYRAPTAATDSTATVAIDHFYQPLKNSILEKRDSDDRVIITDYLLDRGIGRVSQKFKIMPKAGRSRPCGQVLVKLEMPPPLEYT
jgi:hypothetical protein